MVRISDCRMSGTAFGTVVLHVCPESIVGGPLGLVSTGDHIQLDVPNRQLNVLLSDEELRGRRAEQEVRALPVERGYVWLYRHHVLQALQYSLPHPNVTMPVQLVKPMTKRVSENTSI